MPIQLSRLDQRKLALWGLIIILPGIFIELVGISSFLAPQNAIYQGMARLTEPPQILQLFNLIIPAAVLSGALLSFALNSLPVFHFGFDHEDDEVVFTVRIKGRLMNIVVAALSLIVGAVLLGYGLAENWQCLVGLKMIC